MRRSSRSGMGSAPRTIRSSPGMHETAALIAGGSVAAARAIAHGEVDRAVNFCGGLHHAMPDYASGFCVYNDAALGIAALLRGGGAQGRLRGRRRPSRRRRAGRVLRRPAGADRVHPPEPAVAVPRHRLPDRVRATARRTARRSTSRCPRARRTPRGCGPSTRWCPAVVRAFRPEVLVTQHGADSHREDPLADLNLTVDGHRTSYLALRELAEIGHRRSVARAGRRRVLAGAGGAAVVDAPAGDRVRPRHRPGHAAARRTGWRWPPRPARRLACRSTCPTACRIR